MMKRLFWLIGLLVIGMVQSALAVNYKFLHINSQNGLPHQQVEALAQDAKGNLWIGSRNGLSRYDGYDVVTYYHTQETNSLNHNFIHSLHIDSEQRLWVMSENGICRYQSDSDDFRCYLEPKGMFWCVAENKKGDVFFGGMALYRYDAKNDTIVMIPTLGDNVINSLATDQHGQLYVATNTHIFSYDATLTKITRLSPEYYADFMTSSNVIVPLMFDSNDRLWVGRNGQGVMCIDRATGKTRVYPPEQLSSGIVRCITEDLHHRIWLGTEGGITIIHPDGRIEVLQHRYQDDNSLSDNAVYTILCDHHNNIWVGSYFGGVDYLLSDNEQFSFFEPGYELDDLKGRVPRTMVETAPETFWIATEDRGINIFNRKANEFTTFNRIPSIGTNVHSLLYDTVHHEMWIGTRFEGIYRYNMERGSYVKYLRSNGLFAEGCFYIVQQRDGTIWLATMHGLLRYDREKDSFCPIGHHDLDESFIYTMHRDHDDHLWVGTINHGLYHLDTKSNRITNICRANTPGLKDDYIISIFEDSRGTLWIGTNNNGLQYLDKMSGAIGSVTEETLSRCTICSIEEDEAGRLWIGTSQGLFLYNLKTQAIERFSAENYGLPSNQFNFSSSLKSREGLMLFGTINGLITFTPSKIDQVTGPFEVHLKSLIIDNHRVRPSEEGSPLSHDIDNTDVLELTYAQATNITIEYGVILPGNTSTISYQVWLEGVDKTWHDVGNERRLSPFKLPAGTYHLHIRANNTTQGWDDCPLKTITIVVQPPLYRSTWAYLIYLLFITAIGYAVWRLAKMRIQEKNAIRIATMEQEKLRELDRAKFNFFTTVSHELKTPLALIIAPLKSFNRQALKKEEQKNLDIVIKNAQKMEELIGELVTFNKIETDNFPFYLQKGNPLEFIELDLQGFREVSRERQLTLEVNTENNGEEVWFSPNYLEHILNNLMSNALKFTPTGGTIVVDACITGRPDSPFNFLRFDVKDSGIGIVKEELENIFNRYYQTQRGYNTDASGWGIGLSLVQRLVTIHQGDIHVDSIVGKGSTFTVWLNVSGEAFPSKSLITDDKVIVPIDQYRFTPTSSMSVPSPLVAESDSSGNERQTTILLVDDNNDLLIFLRDYFALKYHVLTATNGREALEVAHEHEVQLVITDVMMPEMDGIELCRLLKSSMETSHIPVILLTAKSEVEDVTEGYQSGAEAFVPKPFDPNILQLQVNNILHLVKKRQEDIVNADKTDVESITLSELDKTFIQKMTDIVEDNLANSDFSITDITEALGISRSLLHIKMKNILNISMGDYIRKKRLDKACEMLRQGYNVSETAYATGFSDPNYFSKTFKKHIGQSPSEYNTK